MIAAGVKVLYEGETVDADQLNFTETSKVVGKYQIEDGAEIEIRHEVVNVFRLQNRKKPDGTAIYLVTGSANIVTKPAKVSGE